MNEFARWSMNSQSIGVFAGFVALCLSLRPNHTRVVLAACCYAVVSVAFAWPGVFRQFFEIRMAIAFGGSPVPLVVYVIPVVETAFFLVPIYGLFAPVSAGRWIGFVSFAVILPLMIAIDLGAPYLGAAPDGRSRMPGMDRVFSIPHGLTALLLASLWLRIHSCRVRLEARPDQP